MNHLLKRHIVIVAGIDSGGQSWLRRRRPLRPANRSRACKWSRRWRPSKAKDSIQPTAPLAPSRLIKLPIGAIRPKGWLRSTLELSSHNGVNRPPGGFSPWCKFQGSGLGDPRGRGQNGWEELPYWLKGYGNLGYVLKDKAMVLSVRHTLIAKIASGYQKPDGLTVVRPEEVRDFLFPLPVSKIPGIGRKTTEILKEMDITKVEELANSKVQVLNQRFGKMGILMKQRANGIDLEEVEEREGIKSISRHITFDEDTNDPEVINKGVEMLADSVHGNLIKHRYLFRTITIIVRFVDFTTYTRSKTVPIWTYDINVIKRTAIELLSGVYWSEINCGL